MRYEKGHRERTHKHIVEVASRRFRVDGIAAAGLAGVMKEAGLTNGAFYAHFKSKNDLVRETLIAALDQRRDHVLEALSDEAVVEDVIRDYLSPKHRDTPSIGCPTSALVSEISRQPRKIRTAYTERLIEFVQLIADHIPNADPIKCRQKAMGIFSVLIGAMQLSRAVSDKGLSDQILRDGIEAALQIVARG
ncbi:TetR/AcrR family transcriptional regulator [Bradyrhizobium pachyrhizi]|uniref:TetR/AcrR family transcriptional regulator n=1 Tax=Bradyrhizobium pachyrhizi TaxID=280333 RepID=UPI00067D9935|nr:TetR/AcrR family transcriptional regulator [Bradyrhizobium pachyrhizi]